ncbi:MAG: hypothetical protein JWQ11_1576 [Rhizobacter sp.]|nr:hypothetical protein [Rhizobacter sp.]
MTDDIRPQPIGPSVDETFARLRFAGGRFDSHVIPLGVLPDLAAYGRLIAEVAKMLFKQRMGTRVRVPKGFEDSFQIGLAHIEGGRSAIASMRRLRPVFESDPSRPAGTSIQDRDSLTQTTYPDFDNARDYIDRLIDSVRSTGQVPADFPVELAGFFNTFGQSLRDDEFIEMGFGTANAVRYNTFIRKAIVLSRETTYENSVDARFTLNGGDVALGVVHVLDANGAALDFQPPTEFEFNKAYHRPNESVRLVGTGLYDRNERLRRLVAVNVTYFEGGAIQPFEARLFEIGSTPPGWYDGTNPAPSASAIVSMRQFLSGSDLQSLPAPYLYPLPEGGISAEWTFGDWEASAEIDEAASRLTLNAVNSTSLYELDDVLDLRSPQLMIRFKSFITAMLANEKAHDADR